MITLLWISTVLIVPVLTYTALGFYVKFRMGLGTEFSLWGGLLAFYPMDTMGDIDDVQS